MSPVSNPGGGAGGTPASTVTDETTYGITPAVGIGTAYARDDHTHGSPTEPDLQSVTDAGNTTDNNIYAPAMYGDANNITHVELSLAGGTHIGYDDAGTGTHIILTGGEMQHKVDAADILVVDKDGIVIDGTATADSFNGMTAAQVTDLTDGGATTLHSHAGGPGGEAFPVGSVFIAVVSTDPSTLLGYGTWSAFGAGRVLIGLDGGDANFDTVEETGGSKTVASAGTIDSISGGTPAGTNDSISGGTPAGTNASVSGGTPAGTLDSITGGTPAGTVAWPVGVPTFSGSALAGHTHTFAGGALAGHTHTFTGNALAGHTHTFAGTALAGHTHTFTGSAVNSGGASAGAIQRGATASTLTLATHTHSVTAAGTLNSISGGTPAGTNDSITGGTPAGTNNSISGGTPAGTLDSISGGTPAGTVAWPVGVPSFSGSALAGHTHTFAGGALAGHTHTFTGAALAGHTHTFAGSALGGHTHTYTGSATSVVQPYIVVYMWKRTA
jgi:hypothetical protein